MQISATHGNFIHADVSYVQKVLKRFLSFFSSDVDMDFLLLVCYMACITIIYVVNELFSVSECSLYFCWLTNMAFSVSLTELQCVSAHCLVHNGYKVCAYLAKLQLRIYILLGKFRLITHQNKHYKHIFIFGLLWLGYPVNSEVSVCKLVQLSATNGQESLVLFLSLQ